MRQLTEQEQRFIGGLLLVSLILFLPFSLMIDLTKKPLEDWGKEILQTNEPNNQWRSQVESGNYTNIYLAILWLVIEYGRIISIVFFLSPALKFVIKLGFPSNPPDIWMKYLLFHCKKCDGVFKTRDDFKKHKEVCQIV